MEAKTRLQTTFVASDGNQIDHVSANLGGDLIAFPYLTKLLYEGRIFIGGMGIEETDVDGAAALDDTTPTFVLKAPNAGIVVLPLYVRLQLTTEGGAAPDAYLAYINTGQSTPIAYTSGTAETALNALGGARRDSQATFAHTVTIGAVTSAQNVVLWQSKDMPDNLLSVEAVGTGTYIETVGNNFSTMEVPLFPHIPIALANGSMLAFYAVTGTSDSKWRPTFVWAEVDETMLP